MFIKNSVFYVDRVNLAHEKCLVKAVWLLTILLKEVTNQSNAPVNIPCKYYFVVDDADKMDIGEEESLTADY